MFKLHLFLPAYIIVQPQLLLSLAQLSPSLFSTLLSFSINIIQLWYQYDTDGSGYIEADELKVR